MPNYFILANLFVIPISSAIMYAGIGLVLFSKVGWLSLWIGWGMSYLLKALNYSVKWIESLPYSIWKGVNINLWETYFVYFSVALLLSFFLLKNSKLLQWGMGLLVIVLIHQFCNAIEAVNQRQIIVYSLSHGLAIDFIDGNKNVLLADSSMIYNKGNQSFHITPNWIDLNIKQTSFIVLGNKVAHKSNHLFIEKNYFQFYNKRIALIPSGMKLERRPEISSKLKVDYVILSKNPDINISDISNLYKMDKIIFDNTVMNTNLQKWEKQCKRLGIICSSISRQGAFRIEI